MLAQAIAFVAAILIIGFACVYVVRQLVSHWRQNRHIDSYCYRTSAAVPRALPASHWPLSSTTAGKRWAFLVVDGHDPRIHAPYFCPQLCRYDHDKKLVPLQGNEIRRLIAQSLEFGATEWRPRHRPAEKMPDQPIISPQMHADFDTAGLDMSTVQNSAATGAQPVPGALLRTTA